MTRKREPRKRKLCSVPGCPRVTVANGMCLPCKRLADRPDAVLVADAATAMRGWARMTLERERRT